MFSSVNIHCDLIASWIHHCRRDPKSSSWFIILNIVAYGHIIVYYGMRLMRRSIKMREKERQMCLAESISHIKSCMYVKRCWALDKNIFVCDMAYGCALGCLLFVWPTHSFCQMWGYRWNGEKHMECLLPVHSDGANKVPEPQKKMLSCLSDFLCMDHKHL